MIWYVIARANQFYREINGSSGVWVNSVENATWYGDIRVAQYVASNRGGNVQEHKDYE